MRTCDNCKVSGQKLYPFQTYLGIHKVCRNIEACTERRRKLMNTLYKGTKEE